MLPNLSNYLKEITADSILFIGSSDTIHFDRFLIMRNKSQETKHSDFFDIQCARNETAACHQIVHFNNAGASLMPTPVCEALHSYLRLEERLGGYEAANKNIKVLNGFYDIVAKLLNCTSDEIAFVENATRAWDLAFYSFKFKPGDIILTSFSEYGSNVVAYIQQTKRLGVKIMFIPDDEYGQVDVKALAGLIDDKVKLISITHIPMGGGLVNPVKEIGKIAKAADIPFLLDACQSVGQLPLDVEEIGCDILSATGRKYLRGPRGTGLLYVRKTLLAKLEPPFLDKHAAELVSPTEYKIRGDAKRFESWEQNFAGKFALSKAIEYALSWGLEPIKNRIYGLADKMRDKLKAIDDIIVTDEGLEQCGIVTFISKTVQPAIILEVLASNNINVCSAKGSGSLVSFQKRGLTEVIRASVHYYNTEDEIDYFIKVVKSIFIHA